MAALPAETRTGLVLSQERLRAVHALIRSGEMWMYFGLATIGDPDRSVFIEIRPTEEEGVAELVHLNLTESGQEEGLVLLQSDVDTCFEALDRMADELDADDGLLVLLADDDGSSDAADEVSGESGWIWLDSSHLLNVSSGAFITIGDAEADEVQATVVIYMTRLGGIALFAGSKSEAEEYMFILSGWLGASDVIGEAVGEHAGMGDTAQRAKA